MQAQRDYEEYLTNSYGEDANKTYEQPIPYASMSAGVAGLEVAGRGLIDGDEDMEAEYAKEADGDEHMMEAEGDSHAIAPPAMDAPKTLAAPAVPAAEDNEQAPASSLEGGM